jgi:dihydroflavonol-4-reductase
MIRVLVTGGSGFVGGSLVRKLIQQRINVRCLVRSTSKVSHLSGLDVDYVKGDVTDPSSIAAALHKIDTVFHVAGLTCALQTEQLFTVNANGTRNVARACAEAGRRPPTLVYVSTLAAAGPGQRGEVIDETSDPKPVSDYGRSKLAGEAAVREYADRVPTSIVRPGIVFGARDVGLLEMIRPIARIGVFPVVGKTTPRASFIHVDDLAALLIATADCGYRIPNDARSHRGIYFAATDEFMSLKELGQCLSQLVRPGRKSRVVSIPGWFASSVARLNEWGAAIRGKAELFNRDKVREAMAPSWACSNRLARCELGFRPTATLREQLSATVQWYRENQWI